MSTDGLPRCKPIEKARGGELDEVAIARVVGRQQRQVVALGPARAARRVVVDEVDLTADDRLDAVLGAGLVKLDGAVHHAVIGQSERRLAELRGALRQRLDLARAVEQRVLGVDVQMGAGWLGQRRWMVCGAAADAGAVRSGLAPLFASVRVGAAECSLRAPDQRHAVLVRRARRDRLGDRLGGLLRLLAAPRARAGARPRRPAPRPSRRCAPRRAPRGRSAGMPADASDEPRAAATAPGPRPLPSRRPPASRGGCSIGVARAWRPARAPTARRRRHAGARSCLPGRPAAPTRHAGPRAARRAGTRRAGARLARLPARRAARSAAPSSSPRRARRARSERCVALRSVAAACSASASSRWTISRRAPSACVSRSLALRRRLSRSISERDSRSSSKLRSSASTRRRCSAYSRWEARCSSRS